VQLIGTIVKRDSMSGRKRGKNEGKGEKEATDDNNK
jgi:hypothetical protein